MTCQFTDQYGLTHCVPNQPSENGILFSAEKYMAIHLKRPLTQDELTQIERAVAYSIAGYFEQEKMCIYFNPNPADNNPPDCHYSHDNLLGLYSMCHILRLYGHRNYFEFLPIAKWNQRWWLHPRDVMFYLLMKEYKWNLSTFLSVFAWAILAPACFLSCLSPKTETSGKCLWWLRLNALTTARSYPIRMVSKLCKLIAEAILKRKHGDNPWLDIFGTYFTYSDQPTRIAVETLYGVSDE